METLYCKARRNWELGERLLQGGEYDAAANRLYYGLFQAVKARLVEEGKLDESEQFGVHGKVKKLLRGEHLKDTLEDFRGLRETADYCAEHVDGKDFEPDLMRRGRGLLDNYLKDHGNDCKYHS